MEFTKVISIIIALMILGAITAAAKEFVARRTKRIAGDAFKKPLVFARRWLDLFCNIWTQTTDERPPLKALQMLANALCFPDYETVTNREINFESLPIFRAEVTERREKYPGAHNTSVLDRLGSAFPKIPEEAIKNPRQKIEKAREAFDRLCTLDDQTLDVISELFATTDESKKKQLESKFNKLNRQADGECWAQYVTASIEARQAILRLGVSSTGQAALASVEEVITTTIRQNEEEWKGKLGDAFKKLKDEGRSDEEIAGWIYTILLRESPRWAAYPLLKGEYLDIIVSPDAAISNYLYIRTNEEPLGQYVVPLPQVESVGKVRVNWQSFYDIHLHDSRSVRVPYTSLPNLQKRQLSVQSAATTDIVSPVAKLLAETAALTCSEADRIKQQEKSQPVKKLSPVARTARVVGAPFYVFSWAWSQLSFALLEGGCLFFTVVIVLPLLALLLALLAGTIILPSLVYTAWLNGDSIAAIKWALVWIICLAGILGVVFGVRVSYGSESCGSALQRLGQGRLRWVLILACLGIILIPVSDQLWPGLTGRQGIEPTQGTSVQQYTRFEEDVFSFELPKDWKRMRGSSLEQFRQQFEEQSKQLARQYPHTRAEDFKAVPYLAGFFAPRQETLLIAVVIHIPPQASDYLDRMYEDSKGKIQWGIQQGRIRKAYSNRKTEINGMPLLLVDMEMAGGSRMIAYNFYFSDHPGQGVGLAFICKPGKYTEYQSILNHIVKSLRISFSK